MSIKSAFNSVTQGLGSIIDLAGDSASWASKELKHQADTREKARAIRLSVFKESLKQELETARAATRKTFDKSILSEEELNQIIKEVEDAFN